MKSNLYQVAREYVEVIDLMEKTSDPKKLQVLEERRVDLHWAFIELLKKQGIKFKDREHATRIAYRITNGEL